MENLTICGHETQSSNSSVRVKDSDPIPVDLLIDIFSRVPSKSIARFRCVSKFWGSILQSPDFIELFRTRWCSGFLFTFKVNDEMLYFYSPQRPNPDENSYVVATRYHTSFPKYVPSADRTMLCGLVLRHGPIERRKVRVICNPATGEFFTLPKVLIKDKTFSKVKSRVEGICFGYDPMDKQLKLLCVNSFSNTHRILTLEKGKRLWRRIESEFDFTMDEIISGEVCINGVLYFGASLRESDVRCGIVCFDVRSEKFSLINLDKGIVKEGPFTWGAITLVNYKGKIGIHDKMKGDSISWDRETNGFDLWVLEDAANHKWSKHDHKYPPMWKNILFEHGAYSRLRFIGMTGTGEMVFAPYDISNPFYVFYYNFERKTFTRVNIRGLEEFERARIDTFMDYGENMKLFK